MAKLIIKSITKITTSGEKRLVQLKFKSKTKRLSDSEASEEVALGVAKYCWNCEC